MRFFELYNYWIYILLMMIGLYATIAKPNLVKKILGLGIFQTAIFLLYISMGKVDNGSAPVLSVTAQAYSNPLPHALILTAIVVSVSTMAVAMAIIIKIQRAYGTIELDEIEKADQK